MPRKYLTVNDVVFEKGKWYCKKYYHEMVKYEWIYTANSKNHKKGDKFIGFSHIHYNESLSCSAKGRKQSQEHIDKRANAHVGKHYPNISKGLTGHRVAKETKVKISKSNKGRFSRPY